MMTFDAEQVREGLPWLELVDALRTMFAEGCEQPLRSHFHVGEGDLLLMPAWRSGRYIGVKLVTVFRGNSERNLPAVSGLYILFDGETGQPVAQFDGAVLTKRRTAAASVLAAQFLARPDARLLAVIGTGAVSKALAEAYCANFGIETVTFCGRDPGRTSAVAEELKGIAPNVTSCTSIDQAIEAADIVTSATISTEPLVRRDHLRPGMHIDLVGAFRPDMRESDDGLMSRADGIFVDTREGALKEAGDIVQSIASGAITERSIAADLAELCQNQHPGRRRSDEVTVFKSVGASCEDLAAAQLVFSSAKRTDSIGDGNKGEAHHAQR